MPFICVRLFGRALAAKSSSRPPLTMPTSLLSLRGRLRRCPAGPPAMALRPVPERPGGHGGDR